MISETKYNDKSIKSIISFAKRMENKTIKELTGLQNISHLKSDTNKGLLGTIIEEFYFRYKPNNTNKADFEKAGLELKTTPLKKTKKGSRAKERLVFSIIDYMSLIYEDWESCSFLEKNKLILLIFYLWEKDKEILEYIIKYVTLWNVTSHDFEIIRQDWEIIVKKVKNGKAHEISEGDTKYLAACRKGAGGNSDWRNQPNSSIKALQRAFSFKPKYMNVILDILQEKDDFDRVTKTTDLKKTSFEEVIYSKLNKFKGLSFDEICMKLNIGKPSAKHKAYILTAKMLGAKKGKVEEFEKADIEVKTITLEKTGNLKEAMSFKNFKYVDIIEEADWEDSPVREMFEKKFLFVIFKKDNYNIPRFERAMFYNLPYSDLMEVKKVWAKVKTNTKNGIYTNISSLENPVAHVRNKGADSKSMYPTPDGKTAKKRCFWLNREYIYKVITNE
ncbi:MAG: Sau3AI family type II restriction endonuclease [Candidatus Woesearchaeota archaeon]